MIHRYRGQAALDKSLNARATVADVGPFLTAYAGESAKARATLECRVNVAYGPTPAERIDIFPAKRPASPVFVFIHGGYWRALDAADSSFMAPMFVEAGAAVVAVNYALAPAASIDEIVRQCGAALDHVFARAGEFNGDPARVHVCGSSAGGHLAGMMAGRDSRLQSASMLSGLFDLEPVRLSECNGWAKLDPASAARNSPLRHPPKRPMPIVISYAPNEAEEFAIQSEAYLAVCAAKGCDARFVAEPGTNHFDLPMRLMDRSSALSRAVLEAMGLP
jgi:arylformamidase